MAAPDAPVMLRLVRLPEVDPVFLAELINDAYKKYPFMTIGRTSPEELVTDIGHAEIILAESAGEVVGCAMVRDSTTADWLEDTDDFRHPGSFYYGLAAVPRQHQGKRIGRMLLAEAERLGEERNFHRMLLTTLEEMGNVRYYAGFGYRSVAQHGFEAGHWGQLIPHTHHAMVKDLRLPVRVARPSETNAVTALVNEAYRVEDFFIDGNRTDEAEVGAAIANDQFLVVDGPDGSLAAAAYVEAEGERGYFGMLSVAPKHQNAGLGARLVRAIEEHCQQRGCTFMELTAVNLRTELPDWYARLGYAVTGTAPWPEDALDKLKMPAHFIVMNKPLAPQPAGHEPRR